MISWPEDLINDIARKRCVLFIGSGVSKQSQNAAGLSPKTWAEFLDSAAAMCSGKSNIKKTMKRGDYLTACEIIKNKLGDTKYYDLVNREFLSPRFKSSKIHEYLLDLECRITITPNFDKIYDSYVGKESDGTIKTKTYYDDDLADCIRRFEPVIIKIHGTIDKPSMMVFTRNDYAKARTRFADFYRIIDALALTNTFFFVGCGISDPDIKLLLEDHTFKYGTTKKHYMTIPKGALHKDERNVVEGSMNISFLEYDGKGGHSLLVDSLKELATLVEAEIGMIKSSGSW